MEAIHLEKHKNAVDMDKLLEEIDKLPKVQQTIIHMHLSDKMLPGHSEGRLKTINFARANWLYNGSDT